MIRKSAERRLSLLIEALGDPSPAVGESPLMHAAQLLDASPTGTNVWLASYLLLGELPTALQMAESLNALALEGAESFLTNLADSSTDLSSEMVLVRGAILVDLLHTSKTDLATGIQRVARETARRWAERPDVLLVGWSLDGGSIRALSADERRVALHGGVVGTSSAVSSQKVVPIGGAYLLPELAVEAWRTDRVAALAQYSGLRSGVIGFDCVPLTSGETVGEGMPGAFALNLAAVAQMDTVVTISDAAGAEYGGWKLMLSAAGLTGPTIIPVGLASHINPVSDAGRAAFAAEYLVDGLPLVLVVGSHEPRKNHVAILRAAEEAWSAGAQFRILFVGGNSWNSSLFAFTVEKLKRAGRAISTAAAMPDSELYAAFEAARFTVFPSLNEGFGLPVAESLMSGTPVITSNYGAMAEIASSGGALLVDPRIQGSLSSAFYALATDDELHKRLTIETAQFRARTWDDYADATWRELIERAV